MRLVNTSVEHPEFFDAERWMESAEREFVTTTIAAFRKLGGGTILDVGCNVKEASALPPMAHEPGWKIIRLYNNPLVEPDVLADICDMSVIPTDSVDVVWAARIVEHLPYHQVQVALKECLRCCSPRGVVMVAVPDLHIACATVLQGNLEDKLYLSQGGDEICVIDMIYGMRRPIAAGNDFMRHKSGFIQNTLGRHLVAAGFANVTVWPVRDGLWSLSYKVSQVAPPS